MMIRRDVFEAVGGFDEDYFCYVEDVDLGARARLAGHAAIHVRDAIVNHVGYGSSGRRSVFATWHGTRNRLWTWLKTMPLPLLILTAPLHLAMTLALWLSAARFGHFRLFGRALGDALMGLPGLWRKAARGAVRQAGYGSRLCTHDGVQPGGFLHPAAPAQAGQCPRATNGPLR